MEEIPITALPRETEIFQGIDSDGRLTLRFQLYGPSTVGGRAKLKPASIVALALTELCRKMGKGKVYFCLVDDFGLGQKVQVTRAVSRVPDLLYIPWVWSERDQEIWRDMEHADRFALLHARFSDISQTQSVMPLDLLFNEIEYEEVRLNGSVSHDAGSAATLVIVPQVYLGWTRQLQENSEPVKYRNDFYKEADLPTLRKYLMKDGEAIAGRLWDMYFEKEPRSHVQFRELHKSILEIEGLKK